MSEVINSTISENEAIANEFVGKFNEFWNAANKIKRSDIPKSISDVLGTTNREIVNTIILDIIENSMNKPYIKLSEDVYKALFLLKELQNLH